MSISAIGSMPNNQQYQSDMGSSNSLLTTTGAKDAAQGYQSELAVTQDMVGKAQNNDGQANSVFSSEHYADVPSPVAKLAQIAPNNDSYPIYSKTKPPENNVDIQA